MTPERKKIYMWVGIVLAIILSIWLIWFFFFRSTPSTNGPAANGIFGTPSNTTTNPANNTSGNNNGQPITSQQAATQKIFEIYAGPVVGATLIQTLHPTTTLARYIRQEDGHVYDIPLDVPGAVPRVVSNVTIPGAQRAIWLEQGNAAILQYIDGVVVKSVYLGLPQASTSTRAVATRIQFLPDNIVDLAASPDGASVVYLLKTSSGADGYVAKSDGTGAKKVFSLPLSQIVVSWPATTTLLITTKSASGVAGMAFSVDTKNGAVIPLLYAQGLTTTANQTFSLLLYKKSDDTNQFTYVHNIKNGADRVVSFSPIPEKCIWSVTSVDTLYCATPLQYTDLNYLDLWHQGAASAADSIFSYTLTKGVSSIIAAPGSKDGGVLSDILEMALSPNEHYLSFTTKGARALWGVRLTK